jgi:hypothetical protein
MFAKLGTDITILVTCLLRRDDHQYAAMPSGVESSSSCVDDRKNMQLSVHTVFVRKTEKKHGDCAPYFGDSVIL